MQLNETRAWNRFYAAGTPVDIEPVTGSLVDLLEQRVAQYGERDAIAFFGRTVTYDELGARVARVAEGLRKLGVGAGDRVALIMPNAPQHVIAFYAVLRLGAVVVEHNPLYTRDELEVQFRDHGARTVIAWDKVAPLVQSLPAELGIRDVVSVDVTTAMPLTTRMLLRLPVAKARESRAKLTSAAPGTIPFGRLENSPALAASHPRPSRDDLACLQYTSGTTGVPKGAMITHGNLWANARMGAAWMPDFRHGEGSIYGLLPMFHSFGLLLSVIYSVETGSRAVLFPTFDPELDVLKDNWQEIREEAMRLFDEGYIRAAEKDNDAGFGSFFKKGWKRFYLKWYDKPLPSAEALCPRTVELVSSIPNVKGAMFALLPGGSHLNPHRDPFAGSLRYHLGLSTPNSDACRIYVDGEQYAWRDGEDVMFDETYVHWVKNETDVTRVILFCDIERPLSSPLMTRINRKVSAFLGRATAPQNTDDERVGGINQAYAWSKRFSNKISTHVKQFKRANPKAYRVLRPVLAVVVAYLLYRWLF